jgi:signal transduction histidine kinase
MSKSVLDLLRGTVDSAQMDRLLRATWLRIFAVATALGVLTGLQAYNYVALVEPNRQPFAVLLALNLTYWYSWAALVPGILWMARRYRVGRLTWRRAAAFHLLGVLAFTAAHVALATSARGLILTQFTDRPFDWWIYFRDRFFLNFDWEMMTYWALVGVSHAVDYHRESQDRELAAAQLQTQLAEAQLEALQRQLHPHFLFNTLNTISALMHRDVQAADEMLVRLSDLLRLTLDRVGTQQVPLHDEISFLEKYLEIERTRFGDRLTIRVDVEPDALDAPVPNLVLQPIVENALRHGIAPRVAGGHVDVTASVVGPRLRLTVRDNGVGLSTDRLHLLDTGVGLSNTRSRLENLYGADHRFQFDTPADGGLLVTIEIPLGLDTLSSNGDSRVPGSDSQASGPGSRVPDARGGMESVA